MEKVSIECMENNKLLIGGEWVDNDSERFVVIDPANLKIVGSVPNLSATQIEHAIECAHEAFPKWFMLGVSARREILLKFRLAILKCKDDVAKTISMESGKPLKESLLEVDYSCAFLEWYADCIRLVEGRIIPLQDSQKYATIEYKPLGVAALITSWNFPAAMVMRKLAPALASGCSVIIKPDPRTPITTIKLTQIAHSIGIPKGVINVVMGHANQVGEVLCSSEKVRVLSFTGSTRVGKLLMSNCSKTVKKLILELGGNAPFIVGATADLNQVIDGILFSKFRNNGQTCIAPNRFFVHKKLLTPLVEGLKLRISKLRSGHSLDLNTDIGPLIDANAVSRYESFLDEAQLAKAVVIKIQTVRDLSLDPGYFVDPCIIINKNCEDLMCFNKEHFAPIIPIQPFNDMEDVIRLSNNTESGLAAYLYTQDLKESLEIPERLEFGMVGVNDCFFSDPMVPFGGTKQAGLGVEGSVEGLKEFLGIRYIGRKGRY